MKNKTRYFLISFLITFCTVTLLCFLTLFSGGESEVISPQTDVPKNYIPANSHNLTVLLIGEGESREYALLKLCATDCRAKIISLPSEMPISSYTLSSMQDYGGAGFLKSELSKFFNIEIDRFIRIKSDIFIKILDTLGAMQLTTERDIIRFEEGFSLSKGDHILYFEKILGVMKFDDDGGEIKRLNRQSVLLCEIINKKRDKINDPSVFFNFCVNLIDTDLNAFDYDTRREFIFEFLKNGEAVSFEISSDENFNLSEETLKLISENFS